MPVPRSRDIDIGKSIMSSGYEWLFVRECLKGLIVGPIRSSVVSEIILEFSQTSFEVQAVSGETPQMLSINS